jgi:hypothetical protein
LRRCLHTLPNGNAIIHVERRAGRLSAGFPLAAS